MKKKESLHDRRTQFTRSEIKHSYMEMRQSMPKNKISVTSLCEHANISRGTFYLHYGSIDDVWKDIENDLFQDADQIMNTAINSGVEPEAYLKHQKTSEIWSQIYFSSDLSMELYDKLFEHTVENLQSYLPKGKLTPEEERVYLHFILGGCNAVEKDRYNNPWTNFNKTNAFYQNMTGTLQKMILGRIIEKNEGKK